MTKKHFEKMAKLIKNNTSIYVDRKNNITENQIEYNDFINDLIEYFEQENINFNKDKFIKALGNLSLLNKDNIETNNIIIDDIQNKWEPFLL